MQGLDHISHYSPDQLISFRDNTNDPYAKNLYSLALQKHEPILTENKQRFVLFPIQYNDVWEYYQKSLGSFWTVKEVSLTDDIVQWKDQTLIDDSTRHFIKHILAFFAAADGIVNENLAERFFSEVQIPEIRCVYGFQMMIENIHNEMYSLLIDSYIETNREKDYLFRAIENIPSIKKMADWSLKWLHSNKPFNQRLIAFACVEGIMFSGPFCAIYWLKKRNLLPGLCMSNELISRDEGIHAEFACLLHSLLKWKASEQTILEIVIEVVNLEIEFINESIPCKMIGMNSESMGQYIKFVADRLLMMLGCNKYYHVKNPFDWMALISLQNKTNFFEKRVSEYSRAGFTESGAKEVAAKQSVQLLEDF